MGTRRTAAALRRDPELEDVLEDLDARMAALERIRTRDYDDQLTIVEAFAAPYALAFFHEIRRLDGMLLAWRRRATRPTRRR